MKKVILSLFSPLLLVMVVVSCGDNQPKNNSATESDKIEKGANNDPVYDIGTGPVTSVTLGDINEELAAEGKNLFKVNCSACHKIKKRYIGPAMLGITQRRTPEWIMNMVMNPELMLKDNKTAKKLLSEYIAPMANQNISKKDARAMLEYFRLKDSVK